MPDKKKAWEINRKFDNPAYISTLPKYLLPYLLPESKNALGAPYGIGASTAASAAESASGGGWLSSVGSTVSNIGNSIGNQIWDAGGAIKDAAIGTAQEIEEWGGSAYNAVTGGAEEAASGTTKAPYGVGKSGAEAVADDGGGWFSWESWGDELKNIGSTAWNTFGGLVKSVGAPLAANYVKKKITEEPKNRQQNNGVPENQAKDRAGKVAREKYIKTMQYVKSHAQAFKNAGMTPKEAANHILMKNDGNPPSSDTPVSKFVPQSAIPSGTVQQPSQQPSQPPSSAWPSFQLPGGAGGDIMSMLKQYWYIPAAGGVLVLFMMQQK